MNFCMKFRKPELIPTLFIIAAFLTFVTLGTWQMQRLRWKETIIEETSAKLQMPAVTSFADFKADNLSEIIYRRGVFSGKFLYDKVIHLIGRQQGANIGYYMITPLQLKNGDIILVNRGFSPPGKESRPAGIVKIEGLLRLPREKRFFAPENNQEKNIWSYEDIEKISAMLGKKLPAVVVEEIGKANPEFFPIPGDGKIIHRNDHLGYAITWYLLALVTIIMFAVYYRENKNQRT